MPDGCLDEGTVVAFLDGRLVDTARSSVEDHLATCSDCTELMTLAAAEQSERDRAPEGPPLIGSLAPGLRVDRYQILGAIGRGGMGEVYAAYHPDLDRRIALKVVTESGGGGPERRARLLREARAIARLSHPNVIAVFDAGTVGDRVYIAMEFVEGVTVDAWLRAEARGWREILDVYVAAGRGLAAAHAAGVVHRDFKPQNVMVTRDRSVRVMDFGLARLAEEPPDPAGDGSENASPFPITVTRTGAVLGTLAYMSPEQFRGEPLDARADQFSFCVALHEALYGRRPALAHLDIAPSPHVAEPDAPKPRQGAPTWLRAVIARGLSRDRDGRFPSMDALLDAIDGRRTRVRQRTAAVAVGVALASLTLSAWRLATASHVSCAVPTDRLAAVWPARDETSPRRQAVHRAITAGARPNAETTWQLVAKAIDDYMAQWSAAYVQTCEATHVRGEQSGEVLDLRMACLSEKLDGVRALTEVLAAADKATNFSQAVTAAYDLAPLNHCADVAALRSAIPPPNPKVAETVSSLRRALRDATALEEIGDDRAALAKAKEILPQAEAVGYKPLLGEVLWLKGAVESDSTPATAQATLERSLYVAEASRDDVTGAKAAISLIYVAGAVQSRREESDRWANLAEAILERRATPEPRLRAWLLHNRGMVETQSRRFEAGRPLLERALAIKEAELGKKHPDVARTAIGLAWTLTELGRADEALPLLDRAIEILALDANSIELAIAHNNRGDALNALKRYADAETEYTAALRGLRAQLGPANHKTAYPLHGLGQARLEAGDARRAVPYLTEALDLKSGHDPDAVSVADTQFLLARALVGSGGDRARARRLAEAARETYAKLEETGKRQAVGDWLGAVDSGHAKSPKNE